jgi:hypothetical protein
VVAVFITSTGGTRVQASLSRRSGPELRRSLQKVIRLAASTAKPIVAAEAPVRAVGGGATKRSVSVRGTRRAGEVVGYSIGPRIWYRHFNIGGTDRGIEANPWVERGIEKADGVVKRVLEAGLRADVRL